MSNYSSGAALRHRVPRLAEAAVERARLTVVPRRRVRAARVPFVLLVSMVMLGGVIGLLLFNTQMQQASFAATALESQAGNLAAREQTLTMELEQLRDPQTVADRAVRMGMVKAPVPAFLDLDTGKVEGVPTPATREDALRIHERAPSLPAALSPPDEVVQAEAPPEGVLPTTEGEGRTGAPTGGREGGSVGNSAGDTASATAGNGAREGRTAPGSPQDRRQQDRNDREDRGQNR